MIDLKSFFFCPTRHGSDFRSRTQGRVSTSPGGADLFHQSHCSPAVGYSPGCVPEQVRVAAPCVSTQSKQWVGWLCEVIAHRPAGTPGTCNGDRLLARSSLQMTVELTACSRYSTGGEDEQTDACKLWLIIWLWLTSKDHRIPVTSLSDPDIDHL